MPSKPQGWKTRIRHILDAIAENQNYISGKSYDQFCEDTKTLKAVVWNLTIIGEAARHIPPSAEAAFPEIPWPQIRGMRNRIVHGYEQIDWEIVWKAVREELPPLVPVREDATHSTRVTCLVVHLLKDAYESRTVRARPPAFFGCYPPTALLYCYIVRRCPAGSTKDYNVCSVSQREKKGGLTHGPPRRKMSNNKYEEGGRHADKQDSLALAASRPASGGRALG